VITGLSLLLLFVAMESAFGWPAGRGELTVIIAHTTFCLAYVAVVVQSRLVALDQTLEEAAMDLGAKPSSFIFLGDITTDFTCHYCRLAAFVYVVIGRFSDCELCIRPWG